MLSKEVIKEFDLQDSDIPANMLAENFTDHIHINKQVASCVNEVNKVVYLTKMKYNVIQ